MPRVLSESAVRAPVQDSLERCAAGRFVADNVKLQVGEEVQPSSDLPVGCSRLRDQIFQFGSGWIS
jgi:hypothetical protein